MFTVIDRHLNPSQIAADSRSQRARYDRQQRLKRSLSVALRYPYAVPMPLSVALSGCLACRSRSRYGPALPTGEIGTNARL